LHKTMISNKCSLILRQRDMNLFFFLKVRVFNFQRIIQ
jgi:hypothetical protein